MCVGPRPCGVHTMTSYLLNEVVKMLYSDSIQLYLDYVSSYCSTATIYYYRINLEFFTRYIQTIKGGDFDVKELCKADFVGYVQYLRTRKIKNVSVRTYARAVKVYLRWLFFEEHIENNITVHVKYPKSDDKLVIPLDNSRIQNIEKGLAKCSCQERNKLIISLMLDCGLRLQEVVNLNVSDVEFDKHYFAVIDTKNNKSRLVPLPDKTADLMREYLTKRGVNRDELVLNDKCTTRITQTAIKQLFGRLKQYDKDIHAHLLRHTFATSYIMGGGNFELLRVLMGHSDYNVTKQYVHIATQMELLGLDIYKLDKCMFNAFQVYSYK